MKRAVIFGISFLILFMLCSCVVTQSMSFAPRGSASAPLAGSSHTDIDVDDFFVGVVEDLSSWQSTGNNDPVIDVAISDFAKNLERSAVTSGVRFITDGHNSYVGDFSFTDFERLLYDLSNGNRAQDLLKLVRTDGRTRIELNLRLDNYHVLAEIVPFLADPNFEVWGPLYNNPPYDYLEVDDYKELVAFILGEDGPDSIDASEVTIRFTAPSAVTATNGKKTGANTVEFSFPLIDFLLLHEPIVFYCEF